MDKRVLITGASSGIGRQLSLDYARLGWQVIACGRDQQRLQLLADEHSNISHLSFDVTDKLAVQQAFAILESIPGLIILNAGVCEYIDNGKLDSDCLERVFAANFFGVAHCIEALQDYFYPGLQLGVVSSSASFLALPRAEAYGASKAALSYLIDSLALDLKPHGVRFSLINPGFVETELTAKNDFPMPAIISVEKASQVIIKGLAKGKKHIDFPYGFTRFLKTIAMLPHSWQQKLIQPLVR